MISFRYNQEILTKWQSVGSVEDIQKAEVAALTLLEKAALPPDLLTRVFWEAYLEGPQTEFPQPGPITGGN